jgi:hypothetical protein
MIYHDQGLQAIRDEFRKRYEKYAKFTSIPQAIRDWQQDGHAGPLFTRAMWERISGGRRPSKAERDAQRAAEIATARVDMVNRYAGTYRGVEVVERALGLMHARGLSAKTAEAEAKRDVYGRLNDSQELTTA